MEKIKLSPRLKVIADMVEKGARPVDVGTDHGYLVIHLLEDGVVSQAIAADIRPGPLSRAQQNARAAGAAGLRFCLCDGLDGIREDETDTVVIAGMGGETIAGILERASWTKKDKQLLLQPMSKPEILRRFLFDNGYRIEEERIAADSGKLYSILRACGGEDRSSSEAEYLVGRYDLICREALFLPLISQTEAKLTAALEGLAKSEKAGDPQRAAHLCRVLSQLSEMREKYAESQ